jgi:hypothetical protein
MLVVSKRLGLMPPEEGFAVGPIYPYWQYCNGSTACIIVFIVCSSIAGIMSTEEKLSVAAQDVRALCAAQLRLL